MSVDSEDIVYIYSLTDERADSALKEFYELLSTPDHDASTMFPWTKKHIYGHTHEDKSYVRVKVECSFNIKVAWAISAAMKTMLAKHTDIALVHENGFPDEETHYLGLNIQWYRDGVDEAMKWLAVNIFNEEVNQPASV